MSAGSFNQTVEMTMKKMMLAAAVLAASGSAFAEGMTDKLYVEAGWTWAEADIFSGDWSSTDEKDSAPRLFVGYNINDNFAVEGGIIGELEASGTLSAGTYTGLGLSGTWTVNSTSKITYTANNSYLLGGKFSAPLNDNFNVYGRGGLLWWDVDLNASGSVTYQGTTYTGAFASDDGSDLYYGLGASYAINDKASINADYLALDVDGDDIDSFTIALGYKF
jgi:OOP family OmpA-OmpF porin